MYRNKTEELMDYVIGEAVLDLLCESASVSGATFAARLVEMAARRPIPTG